MQFSSNSKGLTSQSMMLDGVDTENEGSENFDIEDDSNILN